MPNSVGLINGGGLTTYDYDDNNNHPRVEHDPVPLGYRDQIPMYTALSLRDGHNGSNIKSTYEYEVSSPPLWKMNNSPPTSPKAKMGSPLNPSSPKHHNNMSPNSRTQAIARGRKELMDMVRDLPETFYELSLRDIVEKQRPEVAVPEENKAVKEVMITRGEEKNKKSSNKAKKKMARSKSVDNEKFLLKTSVFPILLGSKKSNKSKLGGSGSFKIAPVPKPQPTVPATRSIKGPEKEWWRRRSCISSESDESNGLSSSTSSGSSHSSSRSNSNSSHGRRTSRFLQSCCFFDGRSVKRSKTRDE